jgi:hypothetical protein
VGDYFKNNYGIVLLTPQPLFVIYKVKPALIKGKKLAEQQVICEKFGKVLHIPTQLCLFDGVPDVIRSNAQLMKDALSFTRKTPQQKYEEITRFSKTLFNQPSLKDWGVEIDASPEVLDSKILATPLINCNNGNKSTADEQTLRRLPVQKPVDFLFNTWIVAYEKNNFDEANNLLQTFKAASGKLGITVEEPFWIEMSTQRNMNELESGLDGYRKKHGQPIICVFLIKYESMYNFVK